MRCKYWIPEAAWRDRSVLHCRLQSIHKEIRSPHPWFLTPPGNWDPSCLWVIGGIARIVWSLPLISFSRPKHNRLSLSRFPTLFFWSNLILTSICKRAGMPPFLCVSTLVSKSASMTKKISQPFFKTPTSHSLFWSKTVTFLGKWVN